MDSRRFWNEEAETLPVEKLQKLQEERLQKAIELAYGKTTYYRDLFNRAGLKPEDISSPGDRIKIPFTSDIEVPKMCH